MQWEEDCAPNRIRPYNKRSQDAIEIRLIKRILLSISIGTVGRFIQGNYSTYRYRYIFSLRLLLSLCALLILLSSLFLFFLSPFSQCIALLSWLLAFTLGEPHRHTQIRSHPPPQQAAKVAS